MSDYKTILFDVAPDTGVACLTLNRPDRFNAFNKEMVGEWRDALGRVERDVAIRALVLTGKGKAFCAGGDIDELESFLTMSALERKQFLWDNVHQIPLALERIDCPVIAALNGTARGAGLDMALMCDLRLMDRSVVLAESYIAMGLMPGDGGSYFLPRLVGVPRALELLWTGADITAETAERIGLVNHVTADGTCLEEAMKLAARIARQPTHAIRFTKRAVYQGQAGDLRGHLDMVSSHMSVLEDMPDFRARVEAFKSRRRQS
ncbi:MAG: enoyl-CoA hydratase/isomerase family protein [Reyranellaceae bacterium]